MDLLFVIIAIIILSAANFLLSTYSQHLYLRYYQQHITFEPSAAYKVSLGTRLTSLIISTVGFVLVPLLVWYHGYGTGDTKPLVEALCGYSIVFLAFSISRAVMSTLFFLHIKKNPQFIAGNTTFQIPAVRALNAVTVVQALVLLGIIALFVPSYFLLGGIVGLALISIPAYFMKQAQSNI